MLSHSPEPDIPLAARLFDVLAEKTRDVEGVTRAAYGAGEQFAHELVISEARRAGLEISNDVAGNLFVVLPGAARDGSLTLVGSHLDSVPMGGNFDGAAGVFAALAIVVGWKKAGFRPQHDVAVIAIRAEESNWFPFSYIGSKAALGLLPATALDIRRSDSGRTLAEHMKDLGFDPEALRKGQTQLTADRVRGYIELHIEQGPILIERGIPLGIVTGIRGSFRYRDARIVGEYAHSGAVPRKYRHDAVVAAADLITRLQDEWLRLEDQGHDLTFTVGKLSTDPQQHAFSKIAGQVDLAVDVRSHHKQTLDVMHGLLKKHASDIAAAHDVKIDLGELTGSEPATMDATMRHAFVQAAKKLEVDYIDIPSGAGHDAAVFAQAGIPAAMLFVRNANGSHNPHESMDMDDFATATRVMAAGLMTFV